MYSLARVDGFFPMEICSCSTFYGGLEVVECVIREKKCVPFRKNVCFSLGGASRLDSYEENPCRICQVLQL